MRGVPSSSSLKLARLRSADDNTSATAANSPRSPRVDYEPGIRASYDDLKRPEARQLLREQLTGTFPESARKSSQDFTRSSRMPLKDKLMRRSSKLEVGVHASAKSSTSTVDSVGAKVLSAVPETDAETIDIERAIALLQELKKTASPNELVALHRALLPTKDVETVSSPQLSTFDERPLYSPAPTTSQRRAGLFPGLATRGGPSEDLLRKHGEALFEPQKKTNASKPDGWFQHTNANSVSSLAALDLSSSARAVTPSDFAYAHTGAFGPGTLRVTNGAASPEPSLVGLVCHEQLTAEGLSPEYGYFAQVSTRPGLDTLRGRVSIDVLPGRNVSEDSSQPIRDRIMNSNKAQQQRKQRARRLSAISTDSGESLAIAPLQTLGQVSVKPATQIITGRDSVSPVSIMSDALVPRFQQRLSHRASQISAEYVAECDGATSPYEHHQQQQPQHSDPHSDQHSDQYNALLNFASRLSTVYDSDGDDTEASRGTAEAALSQLLGKSQPQDASRPPVEIGSAGTSDEQIELVQNVQTHKPPPLRKVDSGYGSDASFRLSQRARAAQAGQGRNPAAYNFAPTESLSHVEEKCETGEVQSLYSFEEILKAPALLADSPKATPSPKIAKAKKSSPLLRLHTLTRSEMKTSAPAMPEPLSSQDSNDTAPTFPSTQISPSDTQQKAQQTAKQQKKLQKPMPAALKIQRKEEMRKLKEASANMIMPPTVPDNVFAAHAQRLQAVPMSAALARTYATVDTTNSQEDLTRAVAATPVELAGGDVDFPSPTPSTAAAEGEKRSSSRSRSKSRGRKRSTCDGQSASAGETSADGEGEVHRSWSIANPLRRRSKSKSRTRSQSNQRSSLDIMLGRPLAIPDPQEQEQRAMSPGDESVPAFTDFRSVARTLGAGSYDISTNQFKRVTVTAPGMAKDVIQSPWMISTGLGKGKMTRGMNSEMASELARMKSRDVAVGNAADRGEFLYERPRMVFAPASKKEKGRSASDETARPAVSVEDRFPEWQGKPASRDTSPQRPNILHRPHSMYAESIPPMPELPADVVGKVNRTDEIVAKKLRDSNLKTSPGGSKRNSAEVPPPTKSALAKRSAQGIRTEDEKKVEESKALGLLHPAVRPVAGTKRAHTINVQVREVNGSSSSLSSVAAGDDESAVDDEPAASPTHNARHSGWPGWEQQAKLWRQRRESLGQSRGEQVEEDALPTADSPPLSRKPSMASLVANSSPPLARKPSMEPGRSPAIVVSRYITPLASEHLARGTPRHRASDAAAQHADAYRGLLVDDDSNENRPAQHDVPRTDSAASTSTFVTVKSWDPRPVKQDVPRTDTAGSARTYRTTTSVMTTMSTVNTGMSTVNTGMSPSGPSHVRTASGAYIPYSPTRQNVVERSRALSLARLNGVASPTATNTSSQPLGWAQASTEPPTSLATPSSRILRHGKSSPDALTDRYSGGLDYGWQRETGFSGSAGLRSSGSEGKRKSVQMSEEFGLDLSDVPVFLRKL
ncbi:hypothetical protein LTR08_009077 [Meristemomyces frigidus]|nr:hypothetical protein LTR08_009077 [Meristemomyces frigidus]